jgi:hypothetical protein
MKAGKTKERFLSHGFSITQAADAQPPNVSDK